MSAREDATVAEILTWVTAVIGTAHGINQTHEGLTIVRNMIGQVAIWEGWATPAPHLVFAEDTGILLRYQPGPWVGQLAALAAEPPHAGEGGGMSERVEHTILADWLSARMIIVAWLRELIPHVAPGAAEKAAEALIARFAAHEPPLLLLTPPAEPPLEHGVMLVVRSPRGDGVDLDGYIFLDVAHARRWLQQAFVTEERYMVTYCTFKCRPCCRERYAITRGLSLSVSAFLAETEPAAAAPPAAGEGGG